MVSSARSSPAMTGVAARPAWSLRCGRSVASVWFSVNSYLIQNIAKAMVPANARFEVGATGTNITSRSSAGWPDLPPTAARSQSCYGSNGRRTGISTMRASNGPRSRTTTLTTSTSRSTAIAIVMVWPMAIRSMPICNGNSQRFRPSACRQLRWMATPMAWHPRPTVPQALEIHRPAHPSGYPACRPQFAAGRAGSLCGGGDGTGEDVGRRSSVAQSSPRSAGEILFVQPFQDVRNGRIDVRKRLIERDFRQRRISTPALRPYRSIDEGE